MIIGYTKPLYLLPFDHRASEIDPFLRRPQTFGGNTSVVHKRPGSCNLMRSAVEADC
jgi:hypothetical protein